MISQREIRSFDQIVNWPLHHVSKQTRLNFSRAAPSSSKRRKLNSDEEPIEQNGGSTQNSHNADVLDKKPSQQKSVTKALSKIRSAATRDHQSPTDNSPPSRSSCRKTCNRKRYSACAATPASLAASKWAK